jgi:hypothetical protein
MLSLSDRRILLLCKIILKVSFVGVISEAYALDDYHSRNKELLSFDKDQKIDILAKGIGVHGDKWFGRDVSIL